MTHHDASGLQYHLLDVFTTEPFGGNQLAVFVDAPDLPTDLMQRIARELALSETVFVRPTTAAGAAFRLRIFTPGMELPFAGHPTVGTALLLDALGRIVGDHFRFEEGAGLVPVELERREGSVVARLTAPRVPTRGGEPPPVATLAALLGLSVADIVTSGDAPRLYSAGVPFTIIPVVDRAAIGRINLSLSVWKDAIAGTEAPHVYVICRDPASPAADLRVRMFAPAMGIIEDPATGGAAAALGGYLAERESVADGVKRWVLEQGSELGRPSRIEVDVEFAGGTVRAVKVGGTAVRMGEGTLTIATGNR